MNNYIEFKEVMNKFLDDFVNMGGSIEAVIDICNIQLRELKYNPNEKLEENLKRWLSEQLLSAESTHS